MLIKILVSSDWMERRVAKTLISKEPPLAIFPTSQSLQILRN